MELLSTQFLKLVCLNNSCNGSQYFGNRGVKSEETR